MKVRILKVAKNSAHYGQPYSLIGTVGEVVELESGYPDDSVFLSLKNCVYVKEDPSMGVENGDKTSVFVSEYEVVEE